MSNSNTRPAWMEDELVRSIPDAKLEFLNQMFNDANLRKQNMKTNNQAEMLRILMPIIKQAKAANLSFSPQELQAAITAIRKHSTPEELAQIDKIYNQHMKQTNQPHV